MPPSTSLGVPLLWVTCLVLLYNISIHVGALVFKSLANYPTSSASKFTVFKMKQLRYVYIFHEFMLAVQFKNLEIFNP